MMKNKAKLISALVTIGILFVATFIFSMLINTILHYLVLALRAVTLLIQAVKANEPVQSVHPDWTFHIGYLFVPIKGLNWYVPWVLGLIAVIVWGRQMVLKVSHRVASFFPGTALDIEGKQHFASKRELRNYLLPVPKDHICEIEESGICLAMDKHYYYLDAQTVNTIIVGTTRSGKGQLLVLQTIRIISQCKRPQSFIVFDFKGENIECSYEMLKKQNYNIPVINLDDPRHSSRKDPLAYIKKAYLREKREGDDFTDTIEATKELAHIITDNPKSDPVWPACAQSLLTAIILFLLEDGYKRDAFGRLNMISVINFFLEYGGTNMKVGKTVVNALDNLLSKLPIGHPAKMAYAASKFASGEMRTSIFSTLASNLDVFTDAGIARLTSGNDFEFADLADPNRPTAVFIIVPEGKETRYMVATLFIAQCYAELLDTSKKYVRKILPQRVRFICDELGNMPTILNLGSKITTALGHNILFDLYVQSLTQLEEKYGRLSASNIQGNCGNWVYLNSLDKSTNEYISGLLGNETREYKTYNSDNGTVLDRSRMSHYTTRPLKRPEELPQMPFGDMVVIRQRCYPIYAHMDQFKDLGYPITHISKIPLQENTMSIQSLLYPIAEIGGQLLDSKIPTPGDEDAPAPSAPAVTDPRLQGVINNLNILTHGKFGQALKDKNGILMAEIIAKYAETGQLSEEQVGLLESLVDDKISGQ